MALNCLPIYTYVPTFVASGVACAMDTYQELRGRVPIDTGGTFFRTKNGGTEQNLLSIELIYNSIDDLWTLIVRESGNIVEIIGPGSPPILTGQGADVENVCTPNLITDLRNLVNSTSNYIEMPTIDYGGAAAASGSSPIFDSSAGDDAGCLSAFAEISFTDADGEPADGPTIVGNPPETSPRTGPSRTVIVIVLSEIVLNTSVDDGKSQDIPTTEKVRQWDGTAWVSYVPGEDCR